MADRNDPIVEPDTPEYRQFKKKRQEWRECLSGNDRNSIVNQVISLTWDFAVWNMVNETRKRCQMLPDGSPAINGTVHELINKCFFRSQMIGIRRLVDKHPMEGARGVYSLYRLLEDMKTHVVLMTREHILAAEGHPYDYGPIKEAREKYCSEQLLAGSGAFCVPPELHWETIEDRHSAIDRLSGTEKGKRSPGDTVELTILRLLQDKLQEACTDIGTHVNKFIAHAATPGSRAIVDADSLKLTVAHLREALAAISGVTAFLRLRLVDSASGPFLPWPQFNQLEHLDRPWVRSDKKDEIEEAWNAFREETDSWRLDWEIIGSGDPTKSED